MELTAEERQRFIAWCEARAEEFRPIADAAGRVSTQLTGLVAQGAGQSAAALLTVSVLLGGDPVPAPEPTDEEKT